LFRLGASLHVASLSFDRVFPAPFYYDEQGPAGHAAALVACDGGDVGDGRSDDGVSGAWLHRRGHSPVNPWMGWRRRSLWMTF